MQSHLRALAPALVALLIGVPAAGQSSAPAPVVSIPYVHHVPVLDDFVSAQEDPGAHAAGMVLIDGLTQRAPDDGAAGSEQTRVYIGYDADNVYAAFVCFDGAPSAIRGQLAPRERISDDDDNVALHLDTFGDRKHAYGFQVSAAGVQRDGIWTEADGTWDFSFDAVWYAEARRTPRGYVVLITVPLSSLRFPPGAEQAWGLFVFRELPRKGELAYWPAYSSRRAGRLTQAATATGIRAVGSGRALQLTPYTTVQAAEIGTSAPALSRPAAGLDAKWVVGNRAVVDATFNPDFSHVESDEPQVTVNERFETVFPEKRPFFLENASYFGTPMTLLFTRRVVDPRIGLRLTSKEGPYSVAALVVDDRATSATDAARALVAAARATRNVGRDGIIGAFVSARGLDGHANSIAGLDGRFALGPAWTGTWQAVTTAISHDGRRIAAGPAYTASLTRTGRSTSYIVQWHDRSAGFRAETGYVPRVDIRSLDQTLAYRFRPGLTRGRGGPTRAARLIAWGPDLSVSHVWDRRGTRLDWAVTPRMTFEWTGPVTLALFHTTARQRLRPEEVHALAHPLDTDAGRTGVEVTFSGLRRLVWSAALSGGSGVNLRAIAGREPAPARDVAASVTAAARLARGAAVETTVLHRRLTDRASRAPVVDNWIVRLKATYQFTRALGVRAIVQRDTLRTDAALTPLSPYGDALADVLITYMPAPGRALFFGVHRYGRARTGERAGHGWQLFGKVSYAVQF